VTHPRFRFTIRQLIALIAICAVAFALLRTPFAFLVIALALVLPGFLIERARGGEGILGGAISASLIVAFLGVLALGIAIAVSDRSHPRFNSIGDALLQSATFLFFVSLVAFLLGWLLSCLLYAIVKRSRTIPKRPLLDESCGPIRWRPLHDGQGNHQ
jgi:hypothetical protein